MTFMTALTNLTACRPTVFRRWLVALAIGCVASPPPGAAADGAEPPGLPELVKTRQRQFAIPFRAPATQDPNADAAVQRVVLSVSKDLGATWEPAGETAPQTGLLTYRAAADGEYWFRVRAIDRKGRVRGGEGPDMRVLVDADGPRLAARVWRGTDGEILCRFAAADDSIRLESLKLEYRGKTDPEWKTVAAEGVLSRQSPAHMVGEEIWWAGEKVDSLAVRITIADASGNQTVKQFALEASDPQVDQAALALEIGVPPLPSPSADSIPAVAGDATAAGGPPTASAWPAERPPAGLAGEAATGGRSRSVLVKRSVPTAAEATGPVAEAPRDEQAAIGKPTAADTLEAASLGLADGGPQPLSYRGRPLHLSRSRRISWDYEPQRNPAGAGMLRAELWTTRDGGLSWQQAAVDEDRRSPIDVRLPGPGLYGVRLEMVADRPDGESGPRSGEVPQAWVGVDEQPPQVDLIGVSRDGEHEGGDIVIRYASSDPLLVPRGVRLSYSPHAQGPWATIAEGLTNSGAHRWQPDPRVPPRVYIRVEAQDAAGNVGQATTSDPVGAAQSRFVGKLGGLRAIPASSTP